jgi:TolB-like protein
MIENNVAHYKILRNETKAPDLLARDSVARRRPRKSIDSIAVLPLINSSGDSDVDYFSDGITDSLINSLSRIPKLRVMARSTVLRYRDGDLDPRKVGLDLNVRAVITGRMRKVRNRFFIGAEMVDVADGSRLWGAQFDGGLLDAFSLQDQISRDIEETLRLKLNSGEKRSLAKPDTARIVAQDLYLKGRYHSSKWTRHGLGEAIACYEQSLAIDPHSAAVYSALGAAYSVQAYFCSDPVKTRAAVLKAKACAERALELDPAFPEAHLLAANIAHVHDWEWSLAEEEFKLTLELEPNLADAHACYALFLMDQCQFESAQQEMETALELDALSLAANTAAGVLFFSAGRCGDAISQLKGALELDCVVPISEFDPTYHLSHELLGASLESEQNNEAAVAAYLKLFSGRTKDEEMTSTLRSAFVESGMSGFWRMFAEIADEIAERRVITPIFAATIFARLGETDSALVWLEKALSERTPGLTHINADPRFEKLHSHPRFLDVVRRIGLSTPNRISSERN